MTTERDREVLARLDDRPIGAPVDMITKIIRQDDVERLESLAARLVELVRWRDDNRHVTNVEIALLHGGRSDLATLYRHIVWGEHPETDPPPQPRGPSWDAMRRPAPSPEAIARQEAADLLTSPRAEARTGRILTDAEREGPQP